MSQRGKLILAVWCAVLCCCLSCSAIAAAAGACGQIHKACEEAGFVKGGGKGGNGILRDCIDPLLSGESQPRRAKLALPQVEATTIADCKAENPEYGQRGSAGPAPKSSQTLPEQPAPLPAGAAVGPNIVFILADDFAMNLISSHERILEESMPNLKKMIDEGTTFANYFVTDSLCCPSRSSIFTGKFPHNTGVMTNTPPSGGYAAFMEHNNEPITFAVALHKAGYRTAMLGKYLNGYKPDKSGIPLGWSEWDVDGEKGYSEYNYDLNENGTLRNHPEYLTDAISALGQAYIGAAKRPFFIELASFAPHAPYTPPERYRHEFSTLTYEKSAAFGVRPDATAPEWLQLIPPLEPAEISTMAEAFRNRVRSDHAIDDMIGAVRSKLRRFGLDKNTYVFFSSDNGYHMGEYSLRPGKMTPLDTDIHVPLIVVGPNVQAGRTVTEIVENVDLAPTFTQLAGRDAPTEPDGYSLVGFLRAPPREVMPIVWRDMALIEHRHPGPEISDPDLPEPKSGNPPTYAAIRLADALYVEYKDTKNEIGYYDLNSDPLELHNIAPKLAKEQLQRLRDILQANTNCKGAEDCWKAQHVSRQSASSP